MEVGTIILLEICAVHESLHGTELPIPNVRSSVANGGASSGIVSLEPAAVRNALLNRG
jgi:hypothetical protein